MVHTLLGFALIAMAFVVFPMLWPILLGLTVLGTVLFFTLYAPVYFCFALAFLAAFIVIPQFWPKAAPWVVVMLGALAFGVASIEDSRLARENEQWVRQNEQFYAQYKQRMDQKR